MERPDRNVGGAFWDGLDADMLGAEPLASIDLDELDDVQSRRVIQSMRDMITNRESADRINAYFVSLIDVRYVEKAASIQNTNIQQPSDHQPLIVARLWPNAAFMGARDGGCVNEDEFRDYWFDAETGEFVREANFQETDSLLESQLDDIS